jgi:cardiolipin synthase C
MNFDQRSKSLNTEVGLLVDSPQLAEETALRFKSMTQPENAYQLLLSAPDATPPGHLVWRTQEEGRAVEFTTEPAQSSWRHFESWFLSLLPLSKEL